MTIMKTFAAKIEDFVLSEANGFLSRDEVTVTQAATGDVQAVMFVRDCEGKSVEEVRGELILAMAEADADSHTDAAQPNKERSTGNNAKSQVTTSALWTSHNHGRK